MQSPHVHSGGRYPVLRALAILYLIGAAVTALAGVGAIIWALFVAPYGMGDRLIMGFAAAASACYIAITLLAIAEVLKLFMDVERNTRMTAIEARDRAAAAPAVAVEPGLTGEARSHTNRLDALDDETAEAALLRGH
ncbi:MAG: hypothetical protein WBD40_02410 [Tepidisphaeraceae bacterium]